ncbi:MAG: hypothetical protein J6R02_06780 [Alistipes sp.]|nr:hypothetical protein [Alistipes sp.]
MKKILLTLCVCLISVATFAQDYYYDIPSTDTTYDSIFRLADSYWGIWSWVVYVAIFMGVVWIGLTIKLWKMCDEISDIRDELKKRNN